MAGHSARGLNEQNQRMGLGAITNEFLLYGGFFVLFWVDIISKYKENYDKRKNLNIQVLIYIALLSSVHLKFLMMFSAKFFFPPTILLDL